MFSEAGIQPDLKRVTDVPKAPRPQNVHEARSLLGMVNYNSKYTANFATITTRFMSWLRKTRHSSETLTSAQCMAYFDMQRDTFVTVDASPVWLSAILSQSTPGKDENKVISHTSRGLPVIETGYSQTENEALTIVCGVEHFHLYLYGKQFNLITDHKPLEVIYKGSKSAKVSARIERWTLRL